ncbi:MAG: hypothetical protein WCS25_01440 [Victivallaceae bacterium]|jgi:hypothetical protein
MSYYQVLQSYFKDWNRNDSENNRCRALAISAFSESSKQIEH